MVTFKNTNFIDSEDLIHESLTRTSILTTILKMYPQEVLKEYTFTGGYFSLFNLLNMISKEEKVDIEVNEFDDEITLVIRKESVIGIQSCLKDEFVNKTKERFYNLVNEVINNLIESNKIFTIPVDKELKDHYPPGTPFVVTKVSMNGDKWVKRRFDKTWYLVTKDNLDKEDNILLTVNAYGKLD